MASSGILISHFDLLWTVHHTSVISPSLLTSSLISEMNLESSHQQKSSWLYWAFMKCSYHRRLENFIKPVLCRTIAPWLVMILSTTLFWLFCLIHLQVKNMQLQSTILSLENWAIHHKFPFVYVYQPPAPYLGFFLLSERSSVVVEMTDVVIEWDTLYLFFINSCFWPATCFCASVLLHCR